jgi:UDP-N-acetylglucosamine--N-acetylmuramyl-(pentapeptide) pyrophosphoryl-undecaprenol N-acetylglucosamine transferase
MTYRVLLVGGGSGGHVYPLVAVARALQMRARSQNKKLELLLFGDGPYAARAAREAGIRYRSIVAPKLRRYASAANLLDIFKIPLALAQSLWHLFWFMPDAVFAKGGYTCAFPTWVARLYMIPVYLHESDSVPGLANKILAKRSTLVFTSFPSADAYFAEMGRATLSVGNPIRLELGTGDHTAALAALQLSKDQKTLLIVGGSQGAQQLNDVVLNSLVQMVQKGYNVIHQTGDANFDQVKKAVEQYMREGADSYAALIAAQYRVYPFLDESAMATAYAAADIIVTRAGAVALAEIAYLGKPMIIVPLAGSANDHQAHNAAALVPFGGVVVDGANISPQILLQQVERLLDPAVYADVGRRLKEFAKPDAADKIAEVLLKG